tara:strand:- start:2166 stop:2558 length:393 start_codon:yes stop_codon:yes gene_type:complete
MRTNTNTLTFCLSVLLGIFCTFITFSYFPERTWDNIPTELYQFEPMTELDLLIAHQERYNIDVKFFHNNGLMETKHLHCKILEIDGNFIKIRTIEGKVHTWTGNTMLESTTSVLEIACNSGCYDYWKTLQ